MVKTVVLIWEDNDEGISIFKFGNISSTMYGFLKEIHYKFYGNETDPVLNEKLEQAIGHIKNGDWDKYKLDLEYPIESHNTISMIVISGAYDAP